MKTRHWFILWLLSVTAATLIGIALGDYGQPAAAVCKAAEQWFK